MSGAAYTPTEVRATATGPAAKDRTGPVPSATGARPFAAGSTVAATVARSAAAEVAVLTTVA